MSMAQHGQGLIPMTPDSGGEQGRVGLALLGEQYEALLTEITELDPDLAEHVAIFGFGKLLARPTLSHRDRTLGLAGALAGDGSAPRLLERQLRGALAAGCTPTELREIVWPVY